jgi:hypothetical protein
MTTVNQHYSPTSTGEFFNKIGAKRTQFADFERPLLRVIETFGVHQFCSSLNASVSEQRIGCRTLL